MNKYLTKIIESINTYTDKLIDFNKMIDNIPESEYKDEIYQMYIDEIFWKDLVNDIEEQMGYYAAEEVRKEYKQEKVDSKWREFFNK